MILDTNALSAFAGGEQAMLQILLAASRHQLPVIVLGEYRYGLKRSRERNARERWLDELESVCDVLEITGTTARHYAQIREELRFKGTPIPENDVWIAALAREHLVDIISKDSHFDYVEGIKRHAW